jgi:hypothetical protein
MNMNMHMHMHMHVHMHMHASKYIYKYTMCMHMCMCMCMYVHAHVPFQAGQALGLAVARFGTHESRSSTRGGVAATTAAEGVGCASHARTRSKTIPRRSYTPL